MTQKIAIQDANIMIDLIKMGLFDYCLALDFNFSTTNLILNELYDEQVASIQPHISSGKFVVIEISVVELLDIQQLSEEDTRLSEQDWSAIYFAKKQDALILSGDQRLRNIADAKGIATFGIIWLLDQLLLNKIITSSEACTYLQALMIVNKRLPINECIKRIEIWCEGK